MVQLTPVTRTVHKEKCWHRFTSYRFAQNDHLAPLSAAEITRAVHAMPLAFVRHNRTFVLVGLLSLTPGQNLFVGPDGRWVGDYVPSSFRSYPFGLARIKGEKSPVLCIDENSGLVSDKGGEPFFDDQGAVTPPVKEITNFLDRVWKSRVAADQAVAALSDAGLIIPWTIGSGDGPETENTKGFYKVDESRLNTIDDDIFLKLRKSRSLALAYAQLLSMGNVSVLARLAKGGDSARQTAPRQDRGMVLDDDIIRFE